VNPNVAMLSGVMCHRDEATAIARGLEGQQFFKWALAHYYRFGAHLPGSTSLWEEFQQARREPMAGVDGVGTPDQVRRYFRGLEEAGVDQLILLHQAGSYRHEHICESLHLLGAEVFPEFRERHQARWAARARELAPYVERALARTPPIAPAEPRVVEAYPRLWEQEGIAHDQVGTRRAVDAASLWRLHVGGVAGGRPA
jgi:hypothetical protein